MKPPPFPAWVTAEVFAFAAPDAPNASAAGLTLTGAVVGSGVGVGDAAPATGVELAAGATEAAGVAVGVDAPGEPGWIVGDDAAAGAVPATLVPGGPAGVGFAEPPPPPQAANDSALIPIAAPRIDSA